MIYAMTYWLDPEAPTSRKHELKRYFDLQRYLKKRMGSEQIIITNVDYPDSIQFEEPSGFDRRFAMFSKILGLAQLVRAGARFPIVMHDHDLFIHSHLPTSDSEILVGSVNDQGFSDQVVIYPEITKEEILRYGESIAKLEFNPQLQAGYGTEIRHEGMFSTEAVAQNAAHKPFSQFVVRHAFHVWDQVSHEIQTSHALDLGSHDAEPISETVNAVHGHLNKGPATDELLDWLARGLS